jgi:hypothetical protein
MSRSRRDTTFRKADVMRAIRAAQAVGIPNPRIEIDRHGTITIIPGEPPKDNGTGIINPWDEVLTNDPNQKRPA